MLLFQVHPSQALPTVVITSNMQPLRPGAAEPEGPAGADGAAAAKRLRVDGNGAHEAGGGGSLPGSPRGVRRGGSRVPVGLPLDAGAESATYWNDRPRRQVQLQFTLSRG